MGKIIMNGNAYGSVGSDVEANPQGTATDTLNTIGIDNVIYEIQGGGRNSSGVYVEDNLYDATSGSFGDIVLDKSLLDYDIVVVYPDWDYTMNYDHINTGVALTKEELIKRAGTTNKIILIIDSSHIARYYLSADGKTLTADTNDGATNIRHIVGIKTSGDYFSPVIYSTEEREIGVWKDNKPLYQKTFMLSLTNNSTLIPNTSDIEILAAVKGYVYGDGVNTYLPYSDGEDAVSVWNTSSGVSIYVTSWFLNNGRDQCCITLQYTKTTDAPGSGQYNTLGVPTVHYSTDEQVIGTWIDGSTLYETTFHNVTVHNTGDTLIPTPSNWNVVKLDGYLGRSPDMEHIFLPFQASSIYCRLYADYNVYGGILLESNIEGAATITARYTKTAS